MSGKSESQISPKLLSSLFARFTADRDALLAAVEHCEHRLVDLSERLAAASSEKPEAIEAKADQALALANEALLVAQEALKAARHGRRS
jgi:hypothetical protein